MLTPRFAAPFLSLSLYLSSVILSPNAQAQPAQKIVENLDSAYQWHVLMQAGDRMSDGERYAPDNDRVSYFETAPGRGYLLVGHELHYQNEKKNGQYSRLSYDHGKIVHSELWFKGMHNFCAGNKTPWSTLLSGEEYPMNAFPGTYAERDWRYEHEEVHPQDPAARFGWMYEISPWAQSPDQRAIRRTALGRFSHEGIVVYDAHTVYMTEDWQPGHFFKFVSDRPHDLSSGKLYVYGNQGQWLEIQDLYNVRLETERLQAKPFNKLEDMTLGADGQLYFSESGDPKRQDPYGRVLRFDPKTERLSTFVEGDGKTLSNPDNLALDPRTGRLLICEDQTRANLKAFGNNDVWWADGQGHLRRFLSLAEGREPSGPNFSPDGKTLFMTVIDGKDSSLLQISLRQPQT